VLPLRRERWETPDDDFLDLDFLDPPPQKEELSKTPTVLLLHGFEGSSRAKYILGMLGWIGRLGWRGIALNFRSCSGEINRQPRFYHSGETSDLDWVIRKLNEHTPLRPIFIIGFSLGGNVLLKWLGEGGDQVPDCVRAAVAISVPFDLGIAAKNIDSGFGRVYGRNFLSTLKRKALEKETAHPGLIDRNLIQRIRSYIDFEDRIFAPMHQFKDAQDYWTQCSAKYFLEGIRRSTLILHAMDDPFLPGASVPIDRIGRAHCLLLEMTAFGGHVGFVEGTWPWRPRYWAEARTMAFLSDFTHCE